MYTPKNGMTSVKEADPYQKRANQRDLRAYKAAVRELLRQISQRNHRLSGLKADLDRVQAQVQELEKTRVDLARSEAVVTTLQADKTSLERNLAKSSTELANTRADLATVQESLGYRFMRFYASRIDRLLPDGIRRRQLRKILSRSAR